MTDWPATLPANPRRSGLTRQPRPNIVSFGTEVGPGKRRRRSTARTKLWGLQFFMTATQLATFESFFEDDLKDGALSFNWVDPADSTTWSLLFDADNPYSVTPVSGVEFLVSCNFEGSPSA